MQQQIVRCPHCGADSAGPQFCTTCGGRLPSVIQQPVWEPQIVKCPRCGADSAGPQFCTTCGGRLPSVIQQPVREPQPAPAAEPAVREARPSGKYGALRAVATAYRIIGWVVMIGGSLFSIALAVIAFGGAGALTEFIPLSAGLGTGGIAVVGLIASILYGLFLVAFADLCYVLIDIEKNTRSKE
ncbi:MAG: zinc ribbon domain-containing protein [Dehalococcoidia bacterium]